MPDLTLDLFAQTPPEPRTSGIDPAKIALWVDLFGQGVKPRTPYLNDNQDLVIPFDCDPRYRYWAGGMSVVDTLREINAPPEVIARYWRDYGEGAATVAQDNDGLSWMNKA